MCDVISGLNIGGNCSELDQIIGFYKKNNRLKKSVLLFIHFKTVLTKTNTADELNWSGSN